MPCFSIFSDLHNDVKALEKLMSQKADAYFCAGDLVSWARGLDKMGAALKDALDRITPAASANEATASEIRVSDPSANNPMDPITPAASTVGPGSVYVLPGNHESVADVEHVCNKFGFQNFHGKSVVIGGVRIAGLGYSTITPFDTPGEYTEEQIAEKLAPFAAFPEEEMHKMVLICHSPPRDTALDRIKDGLHGGSRSVRDFIEKHQPAYFFCGHIHEAEGAVIRMGATRAMNVGKKGYVLEL